MARQILPRRTKALPAFVIAFFLVSLCASAQSSLDEIHITPLAHQAAGNAHEATIRVNANLVLVPVTITDGMNRVVTGLDQANFELLENKQRQEIKHFSNQDEPVSLGIS